MAGETAAAGGASGEPEDQRLEVAAAPGETLAAVAEVAEQWGGEWRPGTGGGQLYLPVVAGLRRGLLDARLEARGLAGGGTRLRLSGRLVAWHLHRTAAAVLLLGALGALPVILWPLSARLLALAPLGLVLTFLAWFMVVSRLRTAGAVEFLEAVRDHLDEG